MFSVHSVTPYSSYTPFSPNRLQGVHTATPRFSAKVTPEDFTRLQRVSAQYKQTPQQTAANVFSILKPIEAEGMLAYLEAITQDAKLPQRNYIPEYMGPLLIKMESAQEARDPKLTKPRREKLKAIQDKQRELAQLKATSRTLAILLALGHSNAEISKALNVNDSTISTARKEAGLDSAHFQAVIASNEKLIQAMEPLEASTFPRNWYKHAAPTAEKRKAAGTAYENLSPLQQRIFVAYCQLKGEAYQPVTHAQLHQAINQQEGTQLSAPTVSKYLEQAKTAMGITESIREKYVPSRARAKETTAVMAKMKHQYKKYPLTGNQMQAQKKQPQHRKYFVPKFHT